MCPAKTQISLGIHQVWSESSLCTQWVAKNPRFLHEDSEDSDQTGRMPRLIWVFAGRTCHFVGFVMRRLIYFSGTWEQRHFGGTGDIGNQDFGFWKLPRVESNLSSGEQGSRYLLSVGDAQHDKQMFTFKQKKKTTTKIRHPKNYLVILKFQQCVVLQDINASRRCNRKFKLYGPLVQVK